jgi:hypothetical protein
MHQQRQRGFGVQVEVWCGGVATGDAPSAVQAVEPAEQVGPACAQRRDRNLPE